MNSPQSMVPFFFCSHLCRRTLRESTFSLAEPKWRFLIVIVRFWSILFVSFFKASFNVIVSMIKDREKHSRSSHKTSGLRVIERRSKITYLSLCQAQPGYIMIHYLNFSFSSKNVSWDKTNDCTASSRLQEKSLINLKSFWACFMTMQARGQAPNN